MSDLVRLYMISLDGDDYYVEASSVEEAVTAWRDQITDENGFPPDEPKIVTLVWDEPVIRPRAKE